MHNKPPENSLNFDINQLCPICFDNLSKSRFLVFPCKGRHAFHGECLKSWFLAGQHSCPCDRELVNQEYVLKTLGVSPVPIQTASFCLTPELYHNVNTIFETRDSGDSETFRSSIKYLIEYLQAAETSLSLGSRALPQTIGEFVRTFFGDRIFQFLKPKSKVPTAHYEGLKQTLAMVLRICVSFLHHKYFRLDRSEHNRTGLMIAILRKRSSLHRLRQVAFKSVELLNQSHFFASLSSQDRANLYGANDGLIWYILKRVIADQLPPGSSQLERSLQRSCLLLLDEMYAMWRITDLRN